MCVAEWPDSAAYVEAHGYQCPLRRSQRRQAIRLCVQIIPVSAEVSPSANQAKSCKRNPAAVHRDYQPELDARKAYDEAVEAARQQYKAATGRDIESPF